MKRRKVKYVKKLAPCLLTIKRREKIQRVGFSDNKLSKCIEGKLYDTIDEAYFPPIVNLNPVDNAHELTIEDSKNAYNALYASFNALRENKSIHPLLEEAILYSKPQFMYFVNFFKELENILSSSDLGFEEELEIPYKLMPEKRDKCKDDTFLMQPPLYLEKVRDKYRVRYKSYGSRNYKNMTPLILHRFNYISQFLELEDFREGFPAWYTFNINGAINIFERYVPQLNKRVRIIWNSNEFEYYISGASDNWQKIYDVPLEMDMVIAALLFRN